MPSEVQLNRSTASSLLRLPSINSVSAIGHREILLWLAVLLFANQALQLVDLQSFKTLGASLAEQNYIFWLACYVVIYRLRASDGDARATRLDGVFAVATALSIVLTSFVAYRFGIGLLATTTAAYLLIAYRRDPNLRAAGAVLLAVAAHLVWGPILFQFLTPELLRADAALVGGILMWLRPDILWNDTTFVAPDGHSITLVGACSSFHNLSTALLACVTITMLRRTEWIARDIAAALMACAAMILLNAARLCVLGSDRSSYAYWHEGAGAPILAIAQTLVILLIAWWGVAPRGRKA